MNRLSLIFVALAIATPAAYGEDVKPFGLQLDVPLSTYVPTSRIDASKTSYAVDAVAPNPLLNVYVVGTNADQVICSVTGAMTLDGINVAVAVFRSLAEQLRGQYPMSGNELVLRAPSQYEPFEAIERGKATLVSSSTGALPAPLTYLHASLSRVSNGKYVVSAHYVGHPSCGPNGGSSR